MFVLRKTMVRAVEQMEKELKKAYRQLNQELERSNILKAKMQAIVGEAGASYNFTAADLRPGLVVELVDAHTRYIVEHEGQYTLMYASSDYDEPDQSPELNTTRLGWVDSLDKVAEYMKTKHYRIKLEDGSNSKIHNGD